MDQRWPPVANSPAYQGVGGTAVTLIPAAYCPAWVEVMVVANIGTATTAFNWGDASGAGWGSMYVPAASTIVVPLRMIITDGLNASSSPETCNVSVNFAALGN